MALVKFVKIRMVGWKSSRDDILRELQGTAAVEIVKISEEISPPPLEKEGRGDSPVAETGEELDSKIGQVEFCLKSFSRFRKKGVLESFLPGKVKVGFDEYGKVVEDLRLDKVYENCRRREEKLRELDAEAERLQTRCQELLPWKELDVTPEELDGTECVELLLVKVARRLFDSLREGVEEIGFLKIIEGTKNAVSCLLICLRRERDSVDAVLKDCACAVVRLPEVDDIPPTSLNKRGSRDLKPGEILERIDLRLMQIAESVENLNKETEKASSDIAPLLILHDHLSNIRRRREVLGELGATQSVFVLDGWVRRKDLDSVAMKMERSFPETHVETREPEEGEIPPVELDNKRGVQPFEVVTGLYGLPDHREMDPTPLLAPFFALFFALCLTDAGYGLLLTLLAWVSLRKLNLSRAGRYLAKLLATAGIVTVIVGCLTGGIFGFQFEEVPAKFEFLRTIRNSVMLFDPMKQFLIFLLLSLGLGFVQVWFGFLVKMYQELRTGHLKDAVFGQVPWLLILPGLILMGIVKKPDVVLLGLVEEGFLGGLWGMAASVMVLLGLCGMFVQPGGGNIFKRMGLGVYRLYGIVGCFGDILSYVRLFALGLATLAMAIAINTMAGMAMKIPKIGIIIAIPIFVGGHFFNMVINTLSGFIHTVRLQFVEFFTKFYEGGGRDFRPFAVENKYVEVVSNEVKL